MDTKFFKIHILLFKCFSFHDTVNEAFAYETTLPRLASKNERCLTA